MDEAKKPRLAGRTHLKITIMVAVLVVLLGAAIVGGFLFDRHRSQANTDPAEVKQRIVREVSAIYDTPTNEQPSVALVKDPADLQQSSPFFRQAQSGDYLVLYANSHLVIVYRESQNKIIGIATVSQTQNQNQP